MAQLRRARKTLKVVFAGPAVHGVDIDWTGIDLRRPAQQGDVEAAVADGACVIGLIDGHYQQVGAVWHKEILFALSAGVTVFGASSMGALRAAECQVFGMIPVGDIAHGFCSGRLFDDADVAVMNGPAELGFPALTEPMVTVIATVERLIALKLVAAEEGDVVTRAARSLYFGDRTIESIFEAADLADRRGEVRAAYVANRIDPKACDARALVESVRRARTRPLVRKTWHVAQSPFWTGRTVRSDTVTQQ